MIEKDERPYSLSGDASRLVLRTTSFVADRGSVLHSGIYNREFSSVLASFAFAGAAYFVLASVFGKSALFYAVFMVLFMGGFPLFRTFVFREQYLETVFDKQASKAVICLARLRRKVLETLRLADITGLRIETKKTGVVNRDGVEFVERIAAMHGTVIPGFGEEAVFYSLRLQTADGSERTIFAHGSMQDVLSVYDAIKGFLNI